MILEIFKISYLDNGIGIEKKRLKQIRESLHSPEDQEHHIGIKNTHKRLVLTYPDNPGLTIISHLKQGTCISFSIPKHKK